MLVRAHVFITGEVQGVSFRYRAREQAEALGIAGWIRNLVDGRVEAVFEGEEEKVEEMIVWCKEGSRWAEVDKVEVKWEDLEGSESFEVLPTK
ncbi:MAG: acylphosphatase [Candidatus Chisholmbacteria bacterium]|nr:acylphosphatase [Candidatus Chisholmbacteria bacterium]